MEPTFSLQEFLAWLLTGGGAALIGFWLVGNVSFLEDLKPDYKRYVSFGLTGAVAVLGWLFTLWMGWAKVPGDPQAWVEAIVSVIGTAIVTGQVIHGATSLRQQRLAQE